MPLFGPLLDRRREGDLLIFLAFILGSPQVLPLVERHPHLAPVVASVKRSWLYGNRIFAFASRHPPPDAGVILRQVLEEADLLGNPFRPRVQSRVWGFFQRQNLKIKEEALALTILHFWNCFQRKGIFENVELALSKPLANTPPAPFVGELWKNVVSFLDVHELINDDLIEVFNKMFSSPWSRKVVDNLRPLSPLGVRWDSFFQLSDFCLVSGISLFMFSGWPFALSCFEFGICCSCVIRLKSFDADCEPWIHLIFETWSIFLNCTMFILHQWMTIIAQDMSFEDEVVQGLLGSIRARIRACARERWTNEEYRRAVDLLPHFYRRLFSLNAQKGYPFLQHPLIRLFDVIHDLHD